MTMTPEEAKASHQAAVAKYDKANVKYASVKYNIKTDADILERFKQASNVGGFIKQCIREHMAEEQRRGEKF